MTERSVFVTDAGSVSIAGVLFMPGAEIPLGHFSGREDSLRELVRTNKVSVRRKRMRTDDSGRVIKVDRSAEAPALPSEIDEYDPKRKREIRPLRSRVENASIEAELTKLKREQKERDDAEPSDLVDKVDKAVEEAAEKGASEEELAEIVEQSAPPEGDFEEAETDELFDEDEALLEELEAKD